MTWLSVTSCMPFMLTENNGNRSIQAFILYTWYIRLILQFHWSVTKLSVIERSSCRSPLAEKCCTKMSKTMNTPTQSQQKCRGNVSDWTHLSWHLLSIESKCHERWVQSLTLPLHFCWDWVGVFIVFDILVQHFSARGLRQLLLSMTDNFVTDQWNCRISLMYHVYRIKACIDLFPLFSVNMKGIQLVTLSQVMLEWSSIAQLQLTFGKLVAYTS